MKSFILLILLILPTFPIENGKYCISNYTLTYYPILPYYVKTYEFPAGTKIDVEVKAKNIERIKLDKPIQPAIVMPLNVEEGKINMNSKLYPEKWYDYNIGMGIKNGKRINILSIHLYPIRYNALKNEILHADLQLKIKYSFQKLLFKDEYDLLIICPSQWKQIIQKFVNYKERQGIKTIVAGLNEIMNIWHKDEAEKIKYFIKDCIENYGIKYVLLVGDADVMPVRYVSTIVGEVPCDLYFADIYDANGNFSSWDTNGNGIYGEREDEPDLYPDVYLSRLPASNEEELYILINKSICYTIPPMRAIMVGTELFWDTECREGEYLKEIISEEMNIDIIKLYETNDYEKNDYANSTKIVDYINKGALFVNFACHGNPYGMKWENGSFSINDVEKLHNKYLPIVFAMACSTNEFDTTDCLGEKFLTHPKGAIAYVGSSRVAYVYLGKAIKSSLSGYLDRAFFKAYYDGCTTIGEIFSRAKIDYLEKHLWKNDHDYLTIMEYNLLGDATISIPPMPLTSKACVSQEKSNKGIKIWAEVSGNLTNITIDLYYRKVERWGGKWKFFASSSKKFEWNFLPDEEGYYEFYTILKKENYTEKKPNVADSFCIFDFSPPVIDINKPKEGKLYIFNREILNIKKKFAIVIGRIEIEAVVDVTSVEFYIDNKLKNIDKEEPYKWKWKEFAIGKHEIKVVGYDWVGNKGEDKIDVYAFIL